MQTIDYTWDRAVDQILDWDNSIVAAARRLERGRIEASAEYLSAEERDRIDSLDRGAVRPAAWAIEEMIGEVSGQPSRTRQALDNLARVASPLGTGP